LCVAIAVAIVTLGAGAISASAAEIKVMSSVAFKGALNELVPMFEKTSGDKVVVVYDTGVNVAKRIDAGEAFDVAVVTVGGLAGFTKKGIVSPEPQATLGVSIAALAYKEGTPKPDISTPEAFKSVVLNAKAISSSDPKLGGTSANYFLAMTERLGITADVQAKLVVTKPGEAAFPVGDGRAPIGIAMTSEIALVPGVAGVPLDASDPKSKLAFAAGLSANTKEAKAAQAFIAVLLSAKGADIQKAQGLVMN
jgi:molybdate transport system substrate-binding protein